MPRQRQASSCPRLSSGQTIAPHLLHCDAEQRGDRCLTQRISLVDRIGAVAEVLLLDDDAILDNYETVALRCDLSRQLGCCRQRRTVQACAGCGKKAKSTQLVQRRNGAAGSAAGSVQPCRWQLAKEVGQQSGRWVETAVPNGNTPPTWPLQLMAAATTAPSRGAQDHARACVCASGYMHCQARACESGCMHPPWFSALSTFQGPRPGPRPELPPPRPSTGLAHVCKTATQTSSQRADMVDAIVAAAEATESAVGGGWRWSSAYNMQQLALLRQIRSEEL